MVETRTFRMQFPVHEPSSTTFDGCRRIGIHAGCSGNRYRRCEAGLPHRPTATAAEFGRGLILEAAGWALRGQWRSALSTEAPGPCIFGQAAWAAHSEPWPRDTNSGENTSGAIPTEAKV